MVTEAESTTKARTPLSKERVLAAAIDVADEGGIESLTMRRLAEKLDVEPMSLYYHVANKEAVLDGIVEALMGEVGAALGGFTTPADAGDDWKAAMRDRILVARQTMLRHPWAPGVFETRTRMAPSVVLHFEGLLGIMREGGFSYDLAHHAMHALGSSALGFAQELFAPGSPEEDQESQEMFEHMMGSLPYLAGMMAEISHDVPDSTLGWCDDQTEFEFGLDLILDGLERRLSS